MIRKNSPCPDGVPLHTFEGIKTYVFDRLPPGGFLTAVFSNDLFEASTRADGINVRALPDIMRYIYWHCPRECWGNAEKVEKWLEEEDSSWQEESLHSVDAG